LVTKTQRSVGQVLVNAVTGKVLTV